MRDSSTLKQHAVRQQPAHAAEDEVLAARLQKTCEEDAVKRVVGVTSDAGKLLVVICFMVVHGMSLRLFPKVRPPRL